jgi:inner membrane protein
MVRKKSHKLIGIFIFFIIIYDLALKGITLDFLILPILLLLTIYGSILPDIIEPSRNQHHRKFFHSLFLLAIIIMFIARVYKDLISGEVSNIKMMFAFFMFSGYASHLLVDLLTYKGLPIT